MTTKKEPAAAAEERTQRFRFRVVAPDGRELVSDVVEVRFPLSPPAAATSPSQPAKGAEPAADRPAKDADLALPVTAIYVAVKGQKQGVFHAEAVHQGSKYSFAAHSLEYQLISPRDAVSGLASGQRQHRPLTITRDWGAASPQLFQALVTNEVLESVEIDCYGQPKDGKEQLVHKVKLTNAGVCSFRQVGSVSRGSSKAGTSGDLETVAFAFEKIEHLSPKGAVTASDGVGHG
jgi:type VI secretion system secreted protein Hcp